MKYEIALGALLASAFWLFAAILAGAPSIVVLKDFAGPVATVFAASVAGWVAYTLGRAQVAVAERTWQTSNEKIVLDLFDKRLATFEDIRGVIGEAVREGKVTDDLYNRYCRAIDRVPYFFGEEVQDYLESIRLHLIELQHAQSAIEYEQGAERQKMVVKRSEHFMAVARFYIKSPPLFAAYMKAHQKA
ncbi:hypothetical protein P0R31_30260 [Bradyrhizobium yuanmingense]|uniref:hypothetical protein n=1 Tax=Bradyrhizobium yuanmingense TaxID=108015 RepID=UPI0023B8C33D|nr:hypothetical protein [Bradyrhizobium yuanmingense]MDF0521536.1 hypothetical protein [Bradyrhizobium yuanmingense]